VSSFPDALLWVLGWFGLTVLIHISTRSMSTSAVELIIDHGARLQRFPVATRRRIANAVMWGVDVLTAALITVAIFLVWLL
jgi:hypothetical protein